eukprot:COSAG01_NODE_9587_length_2399_cov_42.102174_2_plen_32_part_00
MRRRYTAELKDPKRFGKNRASPQMERYFKDM